MPYADLLVEIDQLRAERDRLSAEIGTHIDDYHAMGAKLTVAEAERDRLKGENEERLRRNRLIQEQNDRLRAALERAKAEIAAASRGTTHWDGCTERHWDCRIAEIIDEALAGAADETDDEPLAQIESLRLDIMAICRKHGMDAREFIVDYGAAENGDGCR